MSEFVNFKNLSSFFLNKDNKENFTKQRHDDDEDLTELTNTEMVLVTIFSIMFLIALYYAIKRARDIGKDRNDKILHVFLAILNPIIYLLITFLV